MRRGLLYEENFKPQFSGHETFPLRYGWLKKVFDAVYAYELEGRQEETKDLFLRDDAIARFGVEPPPIKESMLDRYFAIHNGNFMGGILNGEEASYGGADYRETAPG